MHYHIHETNMTKSALRILFLLLTVGLGACQYKTEQADKAAATRVVTDGMGRQVTIPMPLEGDTIKVIGLSAAITEMLFAVLPADQVMAVSHVCNYPADLVATKPRVTTYPLAIEQLVALKPDLIFAEEGIVSLDAAAQMERLGLTCYFFKYKTVNDVWAAMDTIGMLTGQASRAKRVTDSLRAAQQTLVAKYAQMKAASAPTVLAIISPKPIYVWGANTFMTDKLGLIGATNAVTENLGKAYPELTAEYVLKLNPDVILGASKAELDSTLFTYYPILKAIKAYKSGRCYGLNGDLSTRPGPRTLQAVDEMGKLIYGAKN